MKKVLFAAFASMLLFASCKKDYTCACTINGIDAGTTTINDTKSKATDECEKNNGSTTLFGVTTTVDCSIQ